MSDTPRLFVWNNTTEDEAVELELLGRVHRLQGELAAMTDKADSLTALYIEAKRERDELTAEIERITHPLEQTLSSVLDHGLAAAKAERDELQVLLQTTRHERDRARECLREAIGYRNKEMSGYDLSKWEEAL